MADAVTVLRTLRLTRCCHAHSHGTPSPVVRSVNSDFKDVVRNVIQPSGQAPLYLADDCCLVSDSTWCSLRSADVLTCLVLRTLNSYGDRTFAAAGPRLWNSLPVQLRNPDIT